MSHTPGPWAVTLSREGLTIWAEESSGEEIAIALVNDDVGNPHAAEDQPGANALLIAAAPDLLAALEALNLQMPPEHIRDDGRSGFAMPVGAIRAAFAAIAKAKGEAS